MKPNQIDQRVQIKVHHTTQTETTREADPNEPWASDDLSHTHSFDGYNVYPVNEKKYWDFIFKTAPKKSDLYLVYVLHSAGNSFHYEEGCCCFVGLYSNLEDAIKVRVAIKQNADKNESMQIPIKLSDGSIENIYTGTWNGYFERFESVNIETLRFNPNN